MASLPYSTAAQGWREPLTKCLWLQTSHQASAGRGSNGSKGCGWNSRESCVVIRVRSAGDHYLAPLWLVSDSFAEKLPASHTAGEALRAPCYIMLKWRMQHKSPEPWPWLWLNAHAGPFPWGMSWLEPINPVLSALSLTLRTWEPAHRSHFRISGVKMKISRVPTVFGKHYYLISVVKANKYPSSWMWFAMQRSCTLLMSVLLCAWIDWLSLKYSNFLN